MPPKISKAEWEVMNVVWTGAPLTATQIFEALPAGHGWKQKTVNTFLARLVDKGVLKADKSGRAHVFSARLSREKCVRSESESFLKQVFAGAAGDLVLHFCANADLTDEEIRELEELLKTKKEGK